MSETIKTVNQTKSDHGESWEFSFISETPIVKWGNSQGVRIPKALMDQLHLSINEKVEISLSGNTICIRKSCQYKNLKERLEAFYNKSIEDIYVESTENDWGPPKGEEIW